MATLIQIHNARHHSTLRSRTEAAVLIASEVVRNEATSVADHAVRLAAANKCLTQEDYLSKFTNMTMFSIGTNDSIAVDPEGATDNDVKWVTETMYTNTAKNCEGV